MEVEEFKTVNFYRLSLVGGVYSGFMKDEKCRLVTNEARAFYITPAFDTMEDDCTFNRVQVKGDLSGGRLEVIVAAANNISVTIDNKECDLREYFADESIAFDQKREAMLQMNHMQCIGSGDMLLHQLDGRYAWVFVSVLNQEQNELLLDGISLEFPKYSFSEYFPEIYQENDFFERYIGIFQSMFLDEEKKVDDLVALLDYERSDDEHVEQLAAWLGIENKNGIFSVDDLRRLIKDNSLYQGRKGTKECIKRLVKLLTGTEPTIVEYFQWHSSEFSSADRKVYDSLYGENGDYFCVIIDLAKTGGVLPISEKDIAETVQQYTNIGSKANVICLTPSSNMDTYCYMDVNSVLSTPYIAGLGNDSIGGHIIVG